MGPSTIRKDKTGFEQVVRIAFGLFTLESMMRTLFIKDKRGSFITVTVVYVHFLII